MIMARQKERWAKELTKNHMIKKMALQRDQKTRFIDPRHLVETILMLSYAFKHKMSNLGSYHKTRHIQEAWRKGAIS